MAGAAALLPEATVLWKGRPLPGPLPPRHQISVGDLFGAKNRLVVGRAPDCDICLPHPMISRYHALLERRPEGLRLRDLASVNGVWVDGKHITEPVPLVDGMRVGIGPFLFCLRDGVIHSVDSSRSLRLEARALEKVVPAGKGQTRRLLDNINLVINPGEFVCLLGPSGSGKSTLMDCLNGRRRATGGTVLANGEDFYRHFNNFRQSLGYVPQKDIVHTQLTVFRALSYTAQLRLPTDTDPHEMTARIEQVLKEMELGPHRDTLIANLSGGQIKRVSLGAELIGQPCLLYIDEATSGLDAGTETRMMRLFRRLSDEGRSIICITHNIENVNQCHLVLILARGNLVYFGPPDDAPKYFGVDRISDIYDRLAERDADVWEKEFAACSLYQEYVSSRLAAPAEPAFSAPGPARTAGSAATPTPQDEQRRRLVASSHVAPLASAYRQLTAGYLKTRERLGPVLDSWHQFVVLTRRYLELVVGDRRSLRLLLLQAPVVAAFLLVGFLAKPYQNTLPSFRPLTDEERDILRGLHQLDIVLNGPDEIDENQRQALRKVRFRARSAAGPTEVDGLALYDVVRQLQQTPPDPNLVASLHDVQFEVTLDGSKTFLSAEKLPQLLKDMHQSHIASTLLELDRSGGSKPFPLVPCEPFISPRYTYMLLFILVVVVVWFGTNNAAKEIVKEEAIYGRERAVNLGILPYVASKFFVLSAITTFHVFALMAVVYGALWLTHLWWGYPLPPQQHMLSYLPQFVVLSLLGMTGVALGLLLSACVATPDRANALLPYVLIPQLILGGGFLDVGHGLLYWLAALLCPVYWAFRAVHLGATKLPEGFPQHVDYADSLWLPFFALVAQTVLLLGLTGWFLRRKEV
jgi:ABC-type multidrug transport system ATPase subunit